MFKAQIGSTPVPSMYKPRRKVKGKSPRVSVTVTPETLAKLARMRAVFYRKYPACRFPTISLIMEKLLSQSLNRLNRNPKQLDAELADFEKRYAVKSATTTSSNEVSR